METVKITFGDGKELTAEENGNCYIVDKRFDDPDLSQVTIEKDGAETILNNAELVDVFPLDDRYWFGLREIPQEQIEKERTDAQIMYTALMTDTLLDEEV